MCSGDSDYYTLENQSGGSEKIRRTWKTFKESSSGIKDRSIDYGQNLTVCDVRNLKPKRLD